MGGLVIIAVRLRTAFVLAFACALTAMSASPALATPGDLDTTFSGNGKVTTNFTSGFDGAGDVAIQADGKIVAAGGAGRNGYAKFALARYKPDGTLDSTFSGDGKVTTKFSSGDDIAYGVAIEADRKIVAAGSGDGKFALARYKPNGALDTTFSGDGKVTTKFSSGAGAGGVAIQTDGGIVAAGGTDGGRFALVRYNPDGTLDSTFGGDGKVTTNFTSVLDWAAGVAIQTDGKIVAAGSAGDGKFAVVRYNPNGTLDTTFSGDGKVTTSLTSGADFAHGVAIQTDGKIVAAGDAGFCCEWTSSFGLVRYNPDGTLDTTFGGDGKVTTDFTSGDDVARDVAIQADGRIVAVGFAGFSGPDSDVMFAIARYNSSGTPDTHVGGDGRVTTNFTSAGDGALGVAIQSGGEIVAAGGSYVSDTDRRFALARYIGG
jgi:uncharacterized delta-60 repeat protein